MTNPAQRAHVFIERWNVTTQGGNALSCEAHAELTSILESLVAERDREKQEADSWLRQAEKAEDERDAAQEQVALLKERTQPLPTACDDCKAARDAALSEARELRVVVRKLCRCEQGFGSVRGTTCQACRLVRELSP